MSRTIFVVCLMSLGCAMASCRSWNSSDAPVDPPAVAQPASAAGSQAVPKGVLTFDALEHDFGEVLHPKTVQHTFTFTNTGTEPVKGIAVQSRCGCASVSLSKKELAPGEKGSLTVELRTAGYDGFIERRITVYAPNLQDRTRLTVRAVVKRN